MAEATLHVELREKKGKQSAKRIRLEGFVPGILYGRGKQPELLTINNKELLSILHAHGRNAVVNLLTGKSKKKIKTFIYEIQHDPLSDTVIHVDFKHISLDEKIHVTIPIHLVGTSEGVKNEGGIMEHIMHTLEIQCLPAEIPEEIVLDVSQLHVGDGINVKDIPHDKFEVLSDPERTVIHIIAPRIAAVEGEAEVVEAEGEEVKEPEVIGKKVEE